MLRVSRTEADMLRVSRTEADMLRVSRTKAGVIYNKLKECYHWYIVACATH